jgi:endoglucanase
MFRLFFLLIAVLSAIPCASAATFQVRRGISLDIWVTWPDESKWGDESVMLPFPEWRKAVGEKELGDLKAAGFDFVRMPVDPSPFLSQKSSALHDKMFEEVAASVDLITKSGLKVIVDMHALPAGGNRSIGTSEILKDGKLFEAHAALIKRMAVMLMNHIPESVALELFNEPTIDCQDEGTNDWPQKLKTLHAAARSATSRLTLILSGACWGGSEGLAKLNPKEFADDNLVWSFHSYDPFILTHQGATWTGDFMPHVYGLPFPLHEAPKEELEKTLNEIRARITNDAPAARVSGHLNYLDEEVAKIANEEGLTREMDKPFAIVSDWAKANNIDPADIILGEFGMIRQEYGNPVIVPGKARAAYVKSMAERAEKLGFAWSVWSYGGAFGVVDGFDGTKAEVDVLEMVRDLN